MNPIKSWAEEDRPREKALANGLASLSNTELLSILINTGTRDASAMELGMRLLSSADNNVSNIARMTVSEISASTKGIGPAKALTIAAAFELGRRHSSVPLVQRQLQCSSQVADFFRPLLADLHHEEFWVVFLSRSNGIIAKQRFSTGGICETVVDTRLIIKFALDKRASAIIVCHNHPSGCVTPSRQDLQLTQKLKSACGMFDISVLDHVVVGGCDYYSFADHGDL